MASIAGSPLDPDRETWHAKPALDVAGFVAQLVPSALTVSAEEYSARLEICATCIYRTAGRFGFRCGCCGCFVAIKAQLPQFHCPQAKWPNDPPLPDHS